ncbi:carbamoyltransferase HypF, partial [bacterium]
YGVMLAYTPLHYMLFKSNGPRFNALVMTSGNMADEPIAADNAEAFEKLSGIADFFLLHDRNIYMRVDDAIARVGSGKTRLLRRSRGYTPNTIMIGEETKDILACGAELKSAFCLTKNSHAIMSQHIGDLENLHAMEFFKETLKNLKNTFRAEPKIIAHDMHPDYLSTRFAFEYANAESIPRQMVVPVQHHHAHIASVMAEHGLNKSVIGIAFDGTGAGLDGTLWGGEFFITDRRHFERKAHFECVALPGGKAAIKEPWRMALSYLKTTFNDGAASEAKRITGSVGEKKTTAILKMIDARLNTPLTSSAGRLFDAVSSLIGLCDTLTFEAEAAIELENTARRAKHKDEKPYAYSLSVQPDAPMRIDFRPLIRKIMLDLKSGVDKESIALRFHVTLADVILDISTRLRTESRINDVALSGGVFQNSLLSGLAQAKLSSAGFNVWLNEQVPANDGGVALGQAIVAWESVKKYFC